MRAFRSLSRDDRGTAVIELAIVAPFLALMTIGVVDLSNAFGRKLALEQAAHRAIEKVMQTTGELTVEETIVAEAAAQAEVDEDQVEVTLRLECDGEVEDDYEASCMAGESEVRYLLVTVSDSYTPLFPVHFSGIDANGVYDLSATAGIRTQ